ncbi:GNAT family N-acetyltransferase [Guggenheimella bovis]
MFSIREAKREDTALILQFIKGLAHYEKMDKDVVATVELLEKWIFDEKKATVLFPEVDGKAVGFALYFNNFSTFEGRAGLYLEDLYIDPEYRGKGYGTSVLKYLAKLAVEKGLGRFEWVCLNWNKPSLELYKNLGAVAHDEWIIHRLDGERLKAFAHDEP